MDPAVVFGALLIGLGIGLMWGFVLGCRQVHAEYAERIRRQDKANFHVNVGEVGFDLPVPKVRP